jgi:hypothetical protein
MTVDTSLALATAPEGAAASITFMREGETADK